MHEIKKPIGALCIAPVLIAKILGNIEITVGSEPCTIGDVQKMGATHVNTTHGEVVSDLKNMIFTTPCYMLDATIVDIEQGTDNLVKTMLKQM
jgi:enhancing lycopene biosynthesis protein 2